MFCLLDSVYFVASYGIHSGGKPFPFTQKFVNVQAHVGLTFHNDCLEAENTDTFQNLYSLVKDMPGIWLWSNCYDGENSTWISDSGSISIVDLNAIISIIVFLSHTSYIITLHQEEKLLTIPFSLNNDIIFWLPPSSFHLLLSEIILL